MGAGYFQGPRRESGVFKYLHIYLCTTPPLGFLRLEGVYLTVRGMPWQQHGSKESWKTTSEGVGGTEAIRGTGNQGVGVRRAGYQGAGDWLLAIYDLVMGGGPG